MTVVILLLALLAFVARRRSEPSARPALPLEDAGAAHVLATPGERHEQDDGLPSQPLLSRPGVVPGKARPAMTFHALPQRAPWQGAVLVALNFPFLKGIKALCARIPIGVKVGRAFLRAS